MDKIPVKSKRKALLALLLVFAPASILIFISSIGCEHKFQKLADFGKIKPFVFIDADCFSLCVFCNVYALFDHSPPRSSIKLYLFDLLNVCLLS